MKVASVKDLKIELKQRSNDELIELCLQLSKFKKENKELLTYLLFESDHEDHYIDIVTLNEKGKFVDSEVDVKVYKLEWRWWWDHYDNDLASYISRSSTIPVDKKTLTTNGGKARYKFRINQQ